MLRREVKPRALDLLRALPRFLVDDPQMRRLCDYVPLARVDARDSLARRRVFHHAQPVPDDAAGIDFAEQDAVAARPIAVDRRGVPLSPARRRNAVAVQSGGDLARRLAGDILCKNAPHDLGLIFGDLKLARLAGDRPVSVSAPAGMPALADDAGHAAPDVQREIFEEHFAHDRAQRAVEARDGAGGGMDRDAEKFEPFAGVVKVGLIARDAIDILGDQHVEGAILGCAHHRLKAGAVDDRCAGDRAILEHMRDRKSLARAYVAAQGDLISDRALAL